MVCTKCKRTFNYGIDYCPYCSCPPEGIWQFLRDAVDSCNPLQRTKE
jgi:hypothetical protein